MKKGVEKNYLLFSDFFIYIPYFITFLLFCSDLTLLNTEFLNVFGMEL